MVQIADLRTVTAQLLVKEVHECSMGHPSVRLAVSTPRAISDHVLGGLSINIGEQCIPLGHKWGMLV